MPTATAVPWHDRHKGKIIGWGLVGTSVAILGVILRADIWPRLVVAGQGLGTLLAVPWKWLWTSHAVQGWLLGLLILATVCAGLLLARLLELLQPPDHPTPMVAEFSLVLDGVQWQGHITKAGLVLDDPVPFCPCCQCQIRPAHGYDYEVGGWSTRLQCEDCHGTNRKEMGNAKTTYNRIARRIEAQWRRGELMPEGGQ